MISYTSLPAQVSFSARTVSGIAQDRGSIPRLALLTVCDGSLLDNSIDPPGTCLRSRHYLRDTPTWGSHGGVRAEYMPPFDGGAFSRPFGTRPGPHPYSELPSTVSGSNEPGA